MTVTLVALVAFWLCIRLRRRRRPRFGASMSESWLANHEYEKDGDEP